MLFNGIARLLMLINTCINPFVYATTIPAFKEIVKSLLRCNLANKMKDINLDESTITSNKKSTDESTIASNKKSTSECLIPKV